MGRLGQLARCMLRACRLVHLAKLRRPLPGAGAQAPEDCAKRQSLCALKARHLCPKSQDACAQQPQGQHGPGLDPAFTAASGGHGGLQQGDSLPARATGLCVLTAGMSAVTCHLS